MENTGNQGPISTEGNVAEVVDNSTQARDKKINDSLEALNKAKDAKPNEAEAEEKGEKGEEQKDDRFASKFAALSRKEKAIKAREAELEKKIKELEAKQAPKPEEKAPEVPFEKRLKKDLFGTLKEAGFDLDTIINIALNDGKMPKEIVEREEKEEFASTVEQKIAALEKKLAEKEENEQRQKLEQEQKANEKAISDFKKEIKKFIDTNTNEYELIAAEGEGMEDLVYEVITKHWEETKDEETGLGELLEIKAAVSQVEEHLLEHAKKYLGKQKIKQLVGASPAKDEQKNEDKKPASVTLSNTQSQTVTGQEKRLKSNEESLRDAAKLIRFK